MIKESWKEGLGLRIVRIGKALMIQEFDAFVVCVWTLSLTV